MESIESTKQIVHTKLGICSDLEALGLVPSQSKVYATLLYLGEARARDISTMLSMHRVEVYRHLKQIVKMQLAEVLLGSPNLYRAVEPHTAVENLYRNLESRMEATKAIKDRLVGSLELLRKSGPAPVPAKIRKDVSYRLITGRRRYYQEVKNYIRDSTKEILGILSGNGVVRLTHSGLLDEYMKCAENGVRIKLICRINEKNNNIVENMLNIAEVRHSDEACMRFLVTDRRCVVMSASFDDENMSLSAAQDIFILIDDDKFARAMGVLFDHSWALCAEARAVIRRIRKL